MQVGILNLELAEIKVVKATKMLESGTLKAILSELLFKISMCHSITSHVPLTVTLRDLDDLNEFWWDDVSRQLHYIPNGTAPPSDIVVPTLINLIEVIGSQAAPVTNVSFVGLTITANRPSFMEPRSNPSGGDWSLERMGAIFLEGTECVSISNSTFERLDSNAVFLSGYNQHASITQNNFRWLGQNAIASWGRPIDNGASPVPQLTSCLSCTKGTVLM